MIIDLSTIPAKILGMSQKGQDSFIDYIFNNIVNPTNKYCVEFGAVDGYLNSNTYLLRRQGWKALLIDNVYSNPDINLIKHTITAENILSLFDNNNVPIDLDFISIDIDGNDYWILKSILTKYKPAVIMVECNIRFSPLESTVQKYNPNYEWNGKDWYGASPLAIKNLCSNYVVIHIHLDDMILIRKDVLPLGTLQRDLRDLYIQNTELYESHKGIKVEENWINV